MQAVAEVAEARDLELAAGLSETEQDVARLMRAAGLVGASRRRAGATTTRRDKRCKEAGVRLSMESVGDAYDDAMCESVFATLECERLEPRRFALQAEARMACFGFSEGWYNPVRQHSIGAGQGHAVVLSVDEKPSIPALERTHGYLKLPTDRAMTGQSHDYKRHGTTTLFAALEVVTGKVTGHHDKGRRVEFLDVMNRVVAEDPEREIHVIRDTLSTLRPKRDLWLARHRNLHFHYAPTHTSRLNQVEPRGSPAIKIWFSILSGKSLNGASFRSVDELKVHISSLIASYNEDARPFRWTKSKVHQKRLKPCFAVQ